MSGKIIDQREKTARPAPPIDVVDGVFHQVGEDPTEVGRPLILVNDHSPLGLRSGAPRVMEGHLQSDELKDLSVSLLLVIEAFKKELFLDTIFWKINSTRADGF